MTTSKAGTVASAIHVNEVFNRAMTTAIATTAVDAVRNENTPC